MQVYKMWIIQSLLELELAPDEKEGPGRSVRALEPCMRFVEEQLGVSFKS
jgi:hypothetical protein